MTFHELIQQLEDDDPSVRAAAIRVLCARGDRRAIEPLLVQLVDDAPTVRVEAAAALGSLRARAAIDPLWDAFTTDPEADVRVAAARALVPMLGDLVLESRPYSEGSTRSRLFELASACGDAGAVQAIQIASRSPDREVADWALLVLRLLGESITSASNPSTALERFCESLTMAELLETLNSPHVFVAQAARDELACRGNPAAIPLLLDEWPRRCSKALAECVTRDSSGACRAALLECLVDGDPRQMAAIGWLAETFADTATMWPLEPLAGVARRSKNPDAGNAADEALERILAWDVDEHRNEIDHLQALRTCLADGSDLVRITAARHMGSFASAMADLAVVLADADDHSSVRVAAAEGLARIDDPGAYEALRDALQDQHPSVRDGALAAIRSRWDNAIEAVTDHRVEEEQRIPALKTLGQLGPDQSDTDRSDACRAIDAVLDDDDCALSDTELFVMIRTLQQLGHREAFDALLTLMVAEDLWSTGHPHDSRPYAELRARARAAMLSLGHETLRQCDFYEVLLWSPCYQLAALDIIGEFADEGLARRLEIERVTEDENPTVRQAALAALEKVASRARARLPGLP
jgi:HEAT repeat protein